MDRNVIRITTIDCIRSLSARRAWIEIHDDSGKSKARSGSLSARRAWIEILVRLLSIPALAVALRKESVDRNACYILINTIVTSRSPQGERG